MATSAIHCEAVLFDLDGVLVDSLALIERILREWATAHGLDPDLAVALSHGRRDVDLVRLVAPHLDAEAEAARITRREEQDFSGLRPVPGASILLSALPPTRWAVVTSGTRRVALGRLKSAGLPSPAHLISADDITNGKPAPEGYLRAAELLGATPDRCVVIEDAPTGVRAALAAGMPCIGLGEAVTPIGDQLVGRIENLHDIRLTPTGGAELHLVIQEVTAVSPDSDV